jgi:hypothetical protein
MATPQHDYYYLVTAVGVFWIRPHPSEPGSWRLGIDLPHGKWRALEEFESPQSAAWAVADHNTGHSNWDELPRSPVDPQELDQWQKGLPPAEVVLKFM